MRTFETSRKVCKETRELACEILKKKELILATNGYKYRQHTGEWFFVNTANKTCTCSRFYSKLTCKNLLTACMKDKLELKGLQVFPKKLVTLRSRELRNRYLDRSHK